MTENQVNHIIARQDRAAARAQRYQERLDNQANDPVRRDDGEHDGRDPQEQQDSGCLTASRDDGGARANRDDGGPTARRDDDGLTASRDDGGARANRDDGSPTARRDDDGLLESREDGTAPQADQETSSSRDDGTAFRKSGGTPVRQDNQNIPVYQNNHFQVEDLLEALLKRNRPFDVVAIDHVDPLTLTNDGNRYLLTFMDLHTSWAEAIPVPDATAATTVETLYRYLICMHGCPKNILSDRGTAFLAGLTEAFFKRLDVNHIQTTSWSPTGSAALERMHGFLGPQLRCLVRDHRAWDRHVPAIMFAYRVGNDSALHDTPFRLVFGRDARLPAQLPDQNTSDLVGNRQVALIRLKQAMYAAERHRAGIVDDRNSRYNKNRRNATYSAGDLVYKHSPAVPQGVSKKLHRAWSGPYRILDQYSQVLFRIAPIHDMDKSTVVHVRRLRLARDTTMPLCPRDAAYRPSHTDAAPGPHYEDVVQQILKRRVRRGRPEALVRWAGRDSSYDSWEPEAELNEAARTLLPKAPPTRSSQRAQFSANTAARIRSSPRKMGSNRLPIFGGYVADTPYESH